MTTMPSPRLPDDSASSNADNISALRLSTPPASPARRSPFIREVLDELRYLLTQPLSWWAVVGPCLGAASRDLARPLARLLLLAVPTLLVSVWLAPSLALPVRAGVVLTVLLLLGGQFVMRFFWHLRYRAAYRYRLSSSARE